MAFPQSPLDVRVALQLAGVWTDVTADTLVRDGITISRGRADEAGQVDPSSCALSLRNPAGKYSPRNPTGPYYGQLGRNTPLRVGVGPPPVGAGTAGQSGTSIIAPSVAAETAGLHLVVWGAQPEGNVTVPGGYTAGTERDSLNGHTWQSAYKTVAAGTTGTATATWSTTTTAAAAMSVFMPGASATVVQSSVITASSVDPALTPTVAAGDWVVAVVGWAADPGGLMNTPPLDRDVGHRAGWVALADTGAAAGPRIRAWARRANTAETLTLGPVSNQWSSPAGAYMALFVVTGATDSWARFHGEAGELPVRWDLSGTDVWTPMQAAGVLRRLGQGASPLRSPVTRDRLTTWPTVALWPMEDPQGSSSFASATGGTPMRFTGTVSGVTLAADEGFVGAEALPTFTGAGANGVVPSYPEPTGDGGWAVAALVAVPAGGMGDGSLVMSVACRGTLAQMLLNYRTASGGSWRFRVIDATGVVQYDSTAITGVNGGRFMVRLFVFNVSGFDIAPYLESTRIDGVTTTGALVTVNDGPGLVTGLQTGRVTSVTVGDPGLLNAPTIGQVAVGSTSNAFAVASASPLGAPLIAWAGERADDRIRRLCREQHVDVYTSVGRGAQLGAQGLKTFLELLREAETADGGVLYEPRGFLGLAYRPRVSKYDQAAAVALTYTTAGQVGEPLEPTDDDQHLANDVTVTRPGGSSARATQTTGALSTAAPPAGVGLYDTSVEVNVFADADLPDQAAWRLHLGTWDEQRYPSVRIPLAAAPSLIPAVASGLDVGARLTIAALPVWLPPGGADLIAEGLSEVLGHVAEWDVVVNASPAGPWRIATLDSQTYGRLDSLDSSLALAAASGATSLTVGVAVGSPLWITTASRPGDFPFDAVAAGEVVTATAIANAVTDSFTRTVANGWGTADSGQAWTLTGTASYWATNGTRGTFTNGAAVNVEGFQDVSGAWQDIDITATVVFQTLPTVANIVAGLWVRRGTSAKIKARLFHTVSDTLNIDVLGANAATILGSASTVLSGVNGTPVRVRLQVAGTTVRLKVWFASVAEPGRWNLDVIDTAAPAAGGVAVSGLRQTGNTNVNPVMEFDDIAVTNPQVWTVTRSVNGVVKAQAAGAQIRLNKPLAIAL